MTSTSTSTSTDPGTDPSTSTGGRALRACLWLVLVVAATGNAVVSVTGAPTPVHVGPGVVSALCVAALVAVHVRARR